MVLIESGHFSEGSSDHIGLSTEDMTQEGQRMNARQALRERKTDDAYQEWVRQLRDRAYVEQRLDNRS